MHSFVQKPKPSQQTKSADSGASGPAPAEQNQTIHSTHHLQHRAGVQSASGLPWPNAIEDRDAESTAAASAHSSHALGEIRAHADRTGDRRVSQMATQSLVPTTLLLSPTPILSPKQRRPSSGNEYVSAGSREIDPREYLEAACTPLIQPKLRIGAPFDRYEQEADRTADAVMRMRDRLMQPKPALREAAITRTRSSAGSIASVQREVGREEDGEMEEESSTKPLHDSMATPAPQIQTRLNALRGGEPLSKTQRAFFEPRFGVDFSAVRIHRNNEATEAARSINARAFTLGRDIVFDARQYQPATSAGRRLLAHELVHTLQQNGSEGDSAKVANAAGPTIRRSAVAHFVQAGYEERAQVMREEFEQTLPYETFLVKLFGIRRRRMRKFDERIELLNPESYKGMQEELTKEFGDKPGKLARKLKSLEKRREKAAKKIGDLPEFGRILEISATYHYVESQTLPNGEIYTFKQSVLDAVKRKFRVGQVWKDLDWNGEKVGVRFDIQFHKAENFEEVKNVLGDTPGESRMVGESLSPQTARTKEYDFTQDPPVTPPETHHTLGQAYDSEIAIDIEAVRQEQYRLKYYEKESDRHEGRAPKDESRSPVGEELDKYLASVIAHEIGHNIGMIHDDKGIMADQIANVKHTRTEVQETTGSGITNDIITRIKISYPDNPVKVENLQRLVDRIPEMTKKGASFWEEEIRDETFSDEPSKDSGITVLQDPSQE